MKQSLPLSHVEGVSRRGLWFWQMLVLTCLVIGIWHPAAASQDAPLKRSVATVPLALPFGAGDDLSFAIMPDGSVKTWGNHYAQAENPWDETTEPADLPDMGKVAQIAVGAHHVVSQASDGRLWARGYRYDGRLGTAPGTRALIPNPVVGISEVVTFAAGWHHTLAVRRDGTVWAWGGGASSLGYGESPVQVPALTDIVAVSAGFEHLAALGADGTTYIWGNEVGHYIAKEGKSRPVLLPGGESTVQIASGNRHLLLLKQDGTVWGWGSGFDGQLGAGEDVHARAFPVRVFGLSDVVQIAAGEYHSLAVRRDGTVWQWGLPAGFAHRDKQPVHWTPTQVPGLSEVVAVSAGQGHSLALKRDGTVWAWGNGDDGQLGHGLRQDAYDHPVQVRGLRLEVSEHLLERMAPRETYQPQTELEGVGTFFEVAHGQKVQLTGLVRNTGLSRVTLSLDGFTDRFLTREVHSSPFSLAEFLIETSSGHLAEPGTYHMRLFAATKADPNPREPLTTITVVVTPDPNRPKPRVKNLSGDFLLTLGDKRNLSGVVSIDSPAKLTRVTLNLPGNERYLSEEVNSEAFDLVKFSIDTRQGPLSQPGVHTLRVWAATTADPDPKEPLATIRVEVLQKGLSRVLDGVFGVSVSSLDVKQGDAVRVNVNRPLNTSAKRITMASSLDNSAQRDLPFHSGYLFDWYPKESGSHTLTFSAYDGAGKKLGEHKFVVKVGKGNMTHRNLYLSRLTATSATIAFGTTASAVSRVYYWEATKDDPSIDPLKQPSVADTGTAFWHHLTLDGLKPNTEYRFYVHSEAAHMSGVETTDRDSFRTLPSTVNELPTWFSREGQLASIKLVGNDSFSSYALLTRTPGLGWTMPSNEVHRVWPDVYVVHGREEVVLTNRSRRDLGLLGEGEESLYPLRGIRCFRGVCRGGAFTPEQISKFGALWDHPDAKPVPVPLSLLVETFNVRDLGRFKVENGNAEIQLWTQYPVVLVHGIRSSIPDAFGSLDRLNSTFGWGLELWGVSLSQSTFDYNSTFTPGRTGAQLIIEDIENVMRLWDPHDEIGPPKVNIVAHSKGGLVVRYLLASTLTLSNGQHPAEVIDKVLTLDTPHSFLATDMDLDAFLLNVTGITSLAQKATSKVVGVDLGRRTTSTLLTQAVLDTDSWSVDIGNFIGFSDEELKMIWKAERSENYRGKAITWIQYEAEHHGWALESVMDSQQLGFGALAHQKGNGCSRDRHIGGQETNHSTITGWPSSQLVLLDLRSWDVGCSGKARPKAGQELRYRPVQDLASQKSIAVDLGKKSSVSFSSHGGVVDLHVVGAADEAKFKVVVKGKDHISEDIVNYAQVDSRDGRFDYYFTDLMPGYYTLEVEPVKGHSASTQYLYMTVYEMFLELSTP